MGRKASAQRYDAVRSSAQEEGGEIKADCRLMTGCVKFAANLLSSGGLHGRQRQQSHLGRQLGA